MSRILIRATNWVGDAVMSLPALQAIRERFPEAYIAVLARPWVADLYARERFADEVLPHTAPRGWRGLGANIALARKLRAMEFDLAILLQNAFEAALIAWMAGIPNRVGYNRDGRGWLLTEPVPVPNPGQIPRHERFYYLELLRRAGIIDELPPCDAIRLNGAREAARQGARRFASMSIGPSVIGMSPGAAYGTAKRWIPERFAEAASATAAVLSADIALFGSDDERQLCEEIAGQIHGRVYNFAGQTTLAEFIELVAACRVYLTNDSGGMHIASALGVPTIAVFGATDDVATGPTGPLARVIKEPVSCSPCLKRECPIDHRCMTGVPAARVVAAALELVK